MFQLIEKSKITNIDTFPVNFNITSTGSLFKALKGNDDKPLQKQTVGFITYQNFFHDSAFSLEVYQDKDTVSCTGQGSTWEIEPVGYLYIDRQRYINKYRQEHIYIYIYIYTHTHTHTYMDIDTLLCMKATWNNKIVLFNSILKC